MSDPRAVLDRLTAAQNAHDLEGMLACFHEEYLSEQPLFPARTFRGRAQVRANWASATTASRGGVSTPTKSSERAPTSMPSSVEWRVPTAPKGRRRHSAWAASVEQAAHLRDDHGETTS